MHFICHHGVKGQHWGIKNGPPYPITKSNDTVFISGSSKTQSEGNPYFRKELPKEITKEIDGYIKSNKRVVIGDAPGIDRQVQDYLNKKGYSNVEIYGPGKQVRYSANKKWKTNPIDSSEFEEYSPDWLAKKDKAMTDVATEGLAVILDEGAKATRNNIDRLLKQNKNVKVYQLSKNGSQKDKFIDYILEQYGDKKI